MTGKQMVLLGEQVCIFILCEFFGATKVSFSCQMQAMGMREQERRLSTQVDQITINDGACRRITTHFLCNVLIFLFGVLMVEGLSL